MLQYDLSTLPTAEELPSTDFEPVDNELQRFVPFLLQQILYFIWPERDDIFFGMDIGYYYDSGQPAISPDGFLSIGVPKRKRNTSNPNRDGRLSYVLWEENYVVPLLVLECVSQNYGGEYDTKKDKYAKLGILYYVIYDTGRYQSEKGSKSKGEAFEVHRLEKGKYIRQEGEPVWLTEIGLGIVREHREFNTWTREWLYWYDQQGNCYPSPDEAFQQAEAKAEREKARAESVESAQQKAIPRLLDLGLTPDQVAEALGLSVKKVEQRARELENNP